MYYPSSKNKDADQLCSYCTADLSLSALGLSIFYCLFMYNGVGLQVLSTLGSACPLQHNNTASMANIFTNTATIRNRK